MSTAIETPRHRVEPVTAAGEQIFLENGALMSRAEFHQLYRDAPENIRAELIGGIVYLSSPVRRVHGIHHGFLVGLMFQYEGATPGVEGGDNTSLLLGDQCEPQPDIYLRTLPEYGGQSRTTEDEYVEGAPELLLEVALSSRSIDLNAKRRDYCEFGVREYMVLIPWSNKLVWFDLMRGTELPVPADGLIKSIQYPGLWLSVPTLLQRNHRAATEVMQAGLASPEHQAFVEQLAQRRAAAK